MGFKLVFGFFAILAALAICEAQDVSLLLKDKAFVRRQINCALDRGACDIIGREIKGLLPEALMNNCRRCTRLQAQQSQQIIEFMQNYYPEEFTQILQHSISRRG